MELLAEIYASDGSINLVDVVEFHSPAWEPVYLIAGFKDRMAYVPETDSFELYLKCDIAVGKESRDNRGNQIIPFIIDNAWADTTKRLVLAHQARDPIEMRVRTYLGNDLSRPVTNTIFADVRSAEDDGTRVNIQAGFYTIYNTNFNREVYDSNSAPAIKYRSGSGS